VAGEGDGDTDGVDALGHLVAAVVVDGHEALRVPKSFFAVTGE
jgi:hypothetical protein